MSKRRHLIGIITQTAPRQCSMVTSKRCKSGYCSQLIQLSVLLFHSRFSRYMFGLRSRYIRADAKCCLMTPMMVNETRLSCLTVKLSTSHPGTYNITETILCTIIIMAGMAVFYVSLAGVLEQKALAKAV